jgi:hypothetical protein
MDGFQTITLCLNCNRVIEDTRFMGYCDFEAETSHAPQTFVLIPIED